jgi:hypothetical protein
VGELLQPQALGFVGEHPLAQCSPVETAVGLDNFSAKMFGYCRQCRAAGFYHHPGGQVGIHHGNSQLFEALGDGGLAAADATSDTDDKRHHPRPVAPR